MRRPLLLPAILFLVTGPGWSGSAGRDLTFEERVEAQRRIERVYWEHRIWSKENGGPRPAFEAAVPEARIRAKVEDSLKKSNALEALWGRPITSEQLQAEMERMARQTRAPEMLGEIFAALGNDPALIAETLARQTLADRLIRSWYARDERFHGETRRQAEATLTGVTDPEQLKSLGAQYTETTWKLRGGDERTAQENPGEIVLEPQAWRDKIGGLAGQRTTSADLGRIPLGKIGPLQEQEDSFSVTTVLSVGRDQVTTATGRWPKTHFDAWWSERAAPLSSRLRHQDFVFNAVSIQPASPCAPDTWTNTPGPPEPRAQHTAVWTGNEMIIWGGASNDGDGRNDGARYNPATDSWAAISTSGAPGRRMGHTAVWTGSEMILWGGRTGSPVAHLNDGGRYNPAADSWSATPITGAPAGRWRHSSVWTGSQMIVWGGSTSAGYANTGARYTPSTSTWTPVTTSGGPAPREQASAIWTGSEMIIWGGYFANSMMSFRLADGGRYSPSTDTWIPTSSVGAPSGRYLHTAVWTGSEMILWGGEGVNGGYLVARNDGARYNPVTNTWVPVTVNGAPQARELHTGVWTGSEMIVWGGAIGFFDRTLNDGARYSPATDTWIPTTAADAPGPRSAHTAVWTGSEMILWGGGGYVQDDLNTGGRYDPSADTWTPTSSIGAPTARWYHTTVWTGSEMIVWGGIWGDSSPQTLDSGGRYDPATDDWAVTSTAGAPVARYGHSAVWTGSDMIVWGGYVGSIDDLVNDGKRYNPSVDTWSPISSVGAPSPRFRHSAVWTGQKMIICCNDGGSYSPATDGWTAISSIGGLELRYGSTIWTGTEMIVWGGYDLTYSDRGARYNPATDTWADLPWTGAPSRRAHHTAVWSGSEMIVWGGVVQDSGYSPPIYLGTGARYKPSTNQWVGMTTAGAPLPRQDHVAVWTGDQMIVWGGASPVNNHNNEKISGGTYNPSLDFWGATSTVGAPLGRSFASAVWTGTEMMVWGGREDSALNSGGRYCAPPAPCPTWYEDLDGDGFGTTHATRTECVHTPGFVRTPGDCNDANPAIHPGVPEVCNGVDEDCNSLVDDMGTNSCGVGGCLRTVPNCSDGMHPTCVPGAPTGEICANSIDDDCDGATDEQGLEVCNGADDNCDGRIDEDISGTDFDADGVPGACDNCPKIPNAQQQDADADLWGDACDNCPAIANAQQQDADADRAGDVCDNCLTVTNGDQNDLDHDGVGDACDAADGLILITVSGTSQVQWQQEPGFEAFNWYRGDLDVLKTSGTYTQNPAIVQLAMRSCGLSGSQVLDGPNPPPGKAVFYLVTGVHLGVEGSLGTNSAGAERPNANPCP